MSKILYLRFLLFWVRKSIWKVVTAILQIIWSFWISALNCKCKSKLQSGKSLTYWDTESQPQHYFTLSVVCQEEIFLQLCRECQNFLTVWQSKLLPKELTVLMYSGLYLFIHLLIFERGYFYFDANKVILASRIIDLMVSIHKIGVIRPIK